VLAFAIEDSGCGAVLAEAEPAYTPLKALWPRCRSSMRSRGSQRLGTCYRKKIVPIESLFSC